MAADIARPARDQNTHGTTLPPIRRLLSDRG
jgi:hypothetical protein